MVTIIVVFKLNNSIIILCLVPEGKENLLSQHMSRPPGFASDGSTPNSTPRTTPVRSLSPKFRVREIKSLEPKHRVLKATPPKFYAIPHNRVAEEGETVRFQCAVAGHPDPWVIWDKDGQIVTPTARITIKEVDDLRIIEIREITTADAGLYRVTLENDVGRVEASARLEIVAHRAFPTRGLRARSSSPKPAPTYRRYFVGTSSRIGGNARFACDVKGLLLPGIRWYKGDTPIVDSDKYTIVSDGVTSVLDIAHVVNTDAGMYKCVVQDECAKYETTGELIVLDEKSASKEPPRILDGLPKDKVVMEGSPLKLQVKVDGSSPFDVIWIKDGCILPDCHDFKQEEDGNGVMSLVIKDPFPQDSGDYRCEVYNPYGDAMSRCHLTVHGKSISISYIIV